MTLCSTNAKLKSSILHLTRNKSLRSIIVYVMTDTILPSTRQRSWRLLLILTSLLCCSRLINAEILEARRRRNNTVYELDLLCDEKRLFANWMALPVPISQASAVEIDVRMTESGNLPRQPYYPTSRMVRANICLVIYRFLYHGASFQDLNLGTNPPCKCRLLRRIVFNFYPLINEDGTPTYKPTIESFGHILSRLFGPQEMTVVIRSNGQSEKISLKSRMRI